MYTGHHSLPTGIRFPFLRGTGFRHKGHKRLFMSQRPMHSSWKWCSQGKRVIISFFFAILLLLRPGRFWIVHHPSRRSMQIAHDGVRVTIASNSDWTSLTEKPVAIDVSVARIKLSSTQRRWRSSMFTSKRSLGEPALSKALNILRIRGGCSFLGTWMNESQSEISLV